MDFQIGRADTRQDQLPQSKKAARWKHDARKTTGWVSVCAHVVANLKEGNAFTKQTEDRKVKGPRKDG